MFGNDAQAVNRRLGYCNELMNLVVLKERYADQYTADKPLFKLKHKQQVLRSLLGGIAVPAADKVMMSTSEAKAHYEGLLTQFKAETDEAKKSKLLLEMKNYLSVQWYAWRSERLTTAFALQQQQMALDELISANQSGVLDQINHLQQNSKIAGLFDPNKAQQLTDQGKQLMAAHDATRNQIYDEQIYPKSDEIFAQKKAIRKEYNERMAVELDADKLQQLEEECADKISVLSMEMSEFKGAIFSKMNADFDQKRAEIEAEKMAMAQAVRDKALSLSTVSQEDAQKWLKEKVTITEQVRNKCKRNKISPEQFEQSIKDFYVISNGRLGKIKICTQNHDRAYADDILKHDKEGFVMLDNRFSLQTLWHELAHHLESDDCLRVLAQHYIRSRSLDGGKVHKLRDLTGNKNYKVGEKAYKTDMFNHYAAKIYDSGETEVFSMGVEAFYSNATLFDAMSSDTKTLEFTTAAIMQPKSDTDQLNKTMRDTLVELDASADNQQANEQERIFNELANLVTWSSTSKTLADLPSDDAAYFTKAFAAVPYAELTFPDGKKYLLLKSSKVKLKSYEGRAMKGVLALEIDRYGEDFRTAGVREIFTYGGISLNSTYTHAIQSQQADTVKVMALAMASIGRMFGVKDTKGEIGEGYLSLANLKKLKTKYLSGGQA